MSSKFFAHTVHVRPFRGGLDDRLPLGDLGGGRDLLAILRDDLLREGQSWDDGAGERDPMHHGEVGRVLELPAERRLHGRILVGTSGIRSDLHRRDGSVVQRQREDVERRPLYFWLNLPERATTGLLLVEQHGHLGVRRAFWEQVVQRRFRLLHHDLLLDIAHYYPLSVWQEYEQYDGELTGATVIARLRPPLSDNQLDDIGPDVDELGTLRIGIDRNFRRVARDSVGRMLRGDASREEAIELLLPQSPDADSVRALNHEEVRLAVDLGAAGKRTVVLGRDSAPRVGYEIQDGIRDDDQGFPDLEAMARQARDLEPVLLGAMDLGA